MGSSGRVPLGAATPLGVVEAASGVILKGITFNKVIIHPVGPEQPTHPAGNTVSAPAINSRNQL